LIEVLRPYGVLEMVRTGRVALGRGSIVEGTRDSSSNEPEAQHGLSFSV
jgi:hypothetical protein